jgi:hypothetical protein
VYGVGSQQAFSNAAVQGSFDAASGEGFQKNFGYIEGANAPKTKIPMTAPVIARTNDTYNWDIGFFVPASLYPAISDIPAPTDSDVTIAPLTIKAFAVIVFGGFASEADFLVNAATLRGYLSRDNVTVVADSTWGQVWAQYDSPATLFNRHNEVWFEVATA